MKPGQLAPGQVGPPQPPPAADSRAALLFARGLEAERRGDFSGARRFYLSSAQQGDAAAARNLGRLYDPAYLAQTALGGIDADPALAQRWYERAVRLGDADAGPLLEALSVR
jgi:TPR repeat protein